MIKKIILFVLLGFLLTLQGCYDDYKVDYKFSTTYFARQFPLRTLVDEEGKDLKFEVGVVLGGKYKNETNEMVDFIIQDTLLKNYPDLKLLPESYYTLENKKITIPKGSFLGTVGVTLDKEKFMNDNLAIGKSYALPLQIVNTTADSILKDKHYSIIVIRYYNKYHAWYYLKGVDNLLDNNGNIVSKEVYSNKDLVKNRAVLLETLGNKSVLVPYIGKNYTNQNEYTMQMDIENEKGTLTGKKTTPLTNIMGTGNYDKLDKKFTLKYNYHDATGALHSVLDTLYFRNTELILEDWK